MGYNTAARIAAVCTLLLSIPVIIWDYWINPAALAEGHLTFLYILISLYLLAGFAFAVFAYGFAGLGRKHQNPALVMSSTALAASYLISVVLAALLPVLPIIIVLDIPLSLLRGVCGIWTGVALLKINGRSNSLYVLVGAVCLLNGALVLLDIVHLSLDDFSTVALAALGYMLLKREA
jgi:hypothetical protein